MPQKAISHSRSRRHREFPQVCSNAPILPAGIISPAQKYPQSNPRPAPQSKYHQPLTNFTSYRLMIQFADHINPYLNIKERGKIRLVDRSLFHAFTAITLRPAFTAIIPKGSSTQQGQRTRRISRQARSSVDEEPLSKEVGFHYIDNGSALRHVSPFLKKSQIISEIQLSNIQTTTSLDLSNLTNLRHLHLLNCQFSQVIAPASPSLHAINFRGVAITNGLIIDTSRSNQNRDWISRFISKDTVEIHLKGIVDNDVSSLPLNLSRPDNIETLSIKFCNFKSIISPKAVGDLRIIGFDGPSISNFSNYNVQDFLLVTTSSIKLENLEFPTQTLDLTESSKLHSLKLKKIIVNDLKMPRRCAITELKIEDVYRSDPTTIFNLSLDTIITGQLQSLEIHKVYLDEVLDLSPTNLDYLVIIASRFKSIIPPQDSVRQCYISECTDGDPNPSKKTAKSIQKALQSDKFLYEPYSPESSDWKILAPKSNRSNVDNKRGRRSSFCQVPDYNPIETDGKAFKQSTKLQVSPEKDGRIRRSSLLSTERRSSGVVSSRGRTGMPMFSEKNMNKRLFDGPARWER